MTNNNLLILEEERERVQGLRFRTINFWLRGGLKIITWEIKILRLET